MSARFVVKESLAQHYGLTEMFFFRGVRKKKGGGESRFTWMFDVVQDEIRPGLCYTIMEFATDVWQHLCGKQTQT